MTLAEFRRTYPAATFTVSSGKLFTYRYYQNPQAKATLVLLTGGIGLSDLFYKHFARFARDFSVLTFDYQLQFGDNGEFADAVAELLRHLKEKVWLVGQSLGGVVAQVIASRHPEVVEGLVLSNTCSLSGNISIARALLKNAPIVLLDEATASLDVENETSLQTALSALLKDKTVLVIAHRMRTVMGADHVVVLADGHVAEEGTPEQLMERGGMFRHMVELQRESSNWQVGGNRGGS